MNNLFIKEYLNIITESNDVIEIKNIDKNVLKKKIDSNEIINLNKRFNLDQIRKYFFDNSSKFICEYMNNRPVALAVLSIENNICFIQEIGSLEKHHGYGKKLLNYILKQPFKLIYLSADWSQPNKLYSYYRNKSFNLKEFINPISDIHWFYKNRMLPSDYLNKFIDKKFI